MCFRVGILGKDPDRGNQEPEIGYMVVVKGGSVEADTVGVPSKPGKDLVNSFTTQEGNLRSRYSILVAAG